MIYLRDVSFAYELGRSRTAVLEGLSCGFRAGEITAIVGPSGCGKTTLLHLIAGLLEPQHGSLDRDGISKGGPVGYVFQTPSLIPWRNVRQNAIFGAEVAQTLNDNTEFWCDRLLAAYGLGGFESSYPNQLSGGMQQRVSIVRAVLSGARIVLLDEPFSNSDYLVRRGLHRELSRLVDENQLVAILVTHDVEDAVRLGDRVIVLTERPARVKTQIDIPVSREERLRQGPKVMRVLEPYLEQICASLGWSDESGTNLPEVELQ